MSAPTIPAEKTGLTREEINRKQKEYIFPSVTNYFSDPLPIDHGFMQHVWDVEGKKYLDFFGGIVTISVGHCNPRVISRTKAQIDRLQHVSTCFPNEPMVTLAEKLAQITPGTLKKSSSLTAALKLTRRRSNRLACTPETSKWSRCVMATADVRRWHAG